MDGNYGKSSFLWTLELLTYTVNIPDSPQNVWIFNIIFTTPCIQVYTPVLNMKNWTTLNPYINTYHSTAQLALKCFEYWIQNIWEAIVSLD